MKEGMPRGPLWTLRIEREKKGGERASRVLCFLKSGNKKLIYLIQIVLVPRLSHGTHFAVAREMNGRGGGWDRTVRRPCRCFAAAVPALPHASRSSVCSTLSLSSFPSFFAPPPLPLLSFPLHPPFPWQVFSTRLGPRAHPPVRPPPPPTRFRR